MVSSVPASGDIRVEALSDRVIGGLRRFTGQPWASTHNGYSGGGRCVSRRGAWLDSSADDAQRLWRGLDRSLMTKSARRVLVPNRVSAVYHHLDGVADGCAGYEYDGSSEELGGNIRDEQSGSGEMVEHISAGEEDGGDVVDNTAGSSPVEPITEEASAPPPSQLKGGSDFLRAKSTPSTLSEEADDQTPSEGDVRPPSGSKGAGRKRLLRNSTESEVRENSDDGLDGKRRPRKSARLG